LIFESFIIERIIAFSVAQIWPLIYCPYFAYKLLKRARTRSTISLSSFFINSSIVFVIALFSIFLIGTPYSKILYSISFYLYMLNQGLLILTIWLMTQLSKKVDSKSIIFFISFYLISASYVFWIGIPFGGIIYGPNTGWRPEFSWLFFWVSISYVSSFLIIPEIFFAQKLLREFKGLPMYGRIKLFIFGIFLGFVENYLLLIYNTWTENLIYRNIHLIFAVLLTAGGAYLVYRGFGRSLK
jgi:hypothetical protein